MLKKIGKKLGLSGRVGGWLVLVVIVTLSIVGYLAYKQGSNALVAQQLVSLEQLADAKEGNILQTAQLHFELVKMVASTLEDLRADGNNSPEVVALAQDRVEHALREISSRSQKSTYEEVDKTSDVLSIGVWDINGNVIADTNNDLVGTQAMPNHFAGVMTRGTYFGGFEVDPATGQHILVFGHNIVSEVDGKVSGVVIMTVDADPLDAVMNNEHVDMGETGEAYLIDKNYMMITESRFGDDVVLKQKVESEAAVKCLRDGEQMVGTYTSYHGELVSGATMNLKDLGWCLIAEMRNSEITAASNSLRNQIILIGIIVVVLISFGSVFIARSISEFIRRPIRAAVEQMGAASSRLSSSTQQSAAASQQNSSIAQQVASGAKEQSDKAEEITKSITEMSSAIQQMASSSKDASEAASETSKLAQDTGEKGMKSRQSLEEIKDMVQGTADMIRGMSEKSKSIGDIVETITSIAEQTNLLALNAAIEAARAGDAGRGFAVVADEVRKLAEGSGKAAEEVKSRIKDMLDQINDNVATVETGVKHAGESSEIINETLSNLQNMAAAIQQVTAKIQEVTAGVDQQSAAVQQVARAMDSIAAISEQNASGAQQLSASAQQQSSANQQVAAAAQQLQMLASDLGSLAGDMKQVSASLIATHRPAIASPAPKPAPKAAQSTPAPTGELEPATATATAHKVTNG